MAFQFPWTNLHELNLDWFLSKFKQFTDNYLGTTATAESVPNGTPPSVTVTGGELDDDTDIVDPFTFNFKIPAGQQGAPGAPGAPGQDGFSPVATVTKSGSVATITITDANGTTTTTISDGEVTQAQLDTKAPVILNTVNGSIASFPDGTDNMPISQLIADITPVQSGSGTPAPGNIRPISGWTGCNVTRTGKNLVPQFRTTQTTSYGLTMTPLANGGIRVHGTSSASSATLLSRVNVSIPIKAGTYTFDMGIRDSANKVYCQIVYTGSQFYSKIAPQTKTLTNDITITRLDIGIGASNGENIDVIVFPQLEVGSIATAYEPYITPSTLSLSWQAEAGTVYGGTIDISAGVLTVTDANIASYAGETLPSTWISDRDVYTPGTNPTTGAQVVYKLANPQTYQLPPQQLFNMLYGYNNIWSDTGNTAVTYPADTKLFIEKLTQPTEDDMVANTAIANGKFFMIGNNLYRATTTIASGSQIIPGTNAKPMSLADALNLL